MATLPCHDPVAKDDVNCVMSTTSQKCRDARDEEKQGKPGTIQSTKYKGNICQP